MKQSVNKPEQGASRPANWRPWYREPWPWVLIAIPLATIIASAITFWLAVTRPDYLVLDEPEYQEIKSDLRAQESAQPLQESEVPDGDG